MATNGHISFERELEALAPITLEEMNGVKLMNRIDAKFLASETGLRAVLADAAAAGCRVLVTEGERQSPYDSVPRATAPLTMPTRTLVTPIRTTTATAASSVRTSSWASTMSSGLMSFWTTFPSTR